jgi:porphobilinogen deaminase
VDTAAELRQLRAEVLASKRKQQEIEEGMEKAITAEKEAASRAQMELQRRYMEEVQTAVAAEKAQTAAALQAQQALLDTFREQRAQMEQQRSNFEKEAADKLRAAQRRLVRCVYSRCGAPVCCQSAWVQSGDKD